MKIKCSVEDKKGKCDKVLSSSATDPSKAFKEVITSLEIHLKGRHQEALLDYQEELKNVQSAMNALPAYMLINGFIDLDDEETSQEFKDGYDELEDLLEPLSVLFEIENEDNEDEFVDPSSFSSEDLERDAYITDKLVETKE